MSENILRCASCGAENSVDNRFCGMCGRSMLAMPAPPVPTAAPSPKAPATEGGSGIRIREVPGGRGSAQEYPADFEDMPSEVPSSPVLPAAPAPAYTGGLFRMGSAESDRPTRNLDYLLEDDEPKSHKGMFVMLGLIALLLAGGLGYLRFRNGTLPNLLGGGKPAAHEATGESSPGAAPTDSANGAVAGESQASNAATPASTTEGGSSAPTDASVPPAPDSKDLTQVRPKNPAESTNAPALAPAAATSPDPKPDAATPKTEVTAPKAEAEAPAAKPAPPPKPAPKPEDSVTLGEKYIYGRGVPQDCTRGLKTVKPAADQSNAKAMITMGALYATGHCVSRDLPTAYRFFAMALRKDPENAALKQNVEMVWSQMTQLERQQAIRLTQ